MKKLLNELILISVHETVVLTEIILNDKIDFSYLIEHVVFSSDKFEEFDVSIKSKQLTSYSSSS